MNSPYDERFYVNQRDSSRQSAEVLMPFVLDLTGARSVVDLGCGVASWLAVAKEHGVEDVLGIDGDYVDEDWLRISPEEFLARDLGGPISVERQFDLAMSLEVAEHLPPERAPSFVADLCALAPIVYFGAAQPHQGGTDHVNERYLDYWIELFAAEGYEFIDCIRPDFWERDISYFYSQNSALFARPGLLPDQPRGPRMPVRAVHPVLVECVLRPPEALRPWVRSAREMISALPAAARTTWHNHGHELPVVGRLTRR
ncbi:MAG: class I SAM-dependent methyltransferase [Microthrixaceae bacterium]|nr:class I SAM-dependent methyltransferase [Microthrixaceae bacterium]